MNYRHAFHAGNFADVIKHVLLTRMLVHLSHKDKPFRAIDTHAGIGLYDLQGDEATRTGEWRAGIALVEDRFEPAVERLLEPYRQVITTTRSRGGPLAYPGSPAIMAALLRPGDRAVFVEKHPEDADRLASHFRQVRNATVMHLDGWTALKSLVPPKERRGLVLIDPPYEEVGELERAGERILRAVGKWRTGLFALWYPIKNMAAVESFYAALVPCLDLRTLRLEILVDDPAVDTRLNGSGLLVVNPPWTLSEEAEILLPALAQRLARGRYAHARCELVAGSL
jgi:23S rRNA (adenine2030-N6)-methyltransferase